MTRVAIIDTVFCIGFAWSLYKAWLVWRAIAAEDEAEALRIEKEERHRLIREMVKELKDKELPRRGRLP